MSSRAMIYLRTDGWNLTRPKDYHDGHNKVWARSPFISLSLRLCAHCLVLYFWAYVFHPQSAPSASRRGPAFLDWGCGHQSRCVYRLADRHLTVGVRRVDAAVAGSWSTPRLDSSSHARGGRVCSLPHVVRSGQSSHDCSEHDFPSVDCTAVPADSRSVAAQGTCPPTGPR